MQSKYPKTYQRLQKPRTKSSPQYQNFSFHFGARSKSEKVKPRKQRAATVAIADDGGRVVAQEWNRDRIA